MVRLCFALLLLYKQQDRIHMPCGLMDDLEGEVAGEEVHEGGLGEDIFSADLNREDALLTNIGEHRVRRIYMVKTIFIVVFSQYLVSPHTLLSSSTRLSRYSLRLS